MNNNLQHKLDNICDRFQELEGLLADEVVINNQDKFREYSQEYHQLSSIVSCYQQLKQASQDLEDAKELNDDSDPEMRILATEEIAKSKQGYQELLQELQILLIPKEGGDDKNVFLEIRAGTGGDEAAIFVGDLLKMYGKFAESKSWKMEIISANPSEQGGYKEIISRISGSRVYATLKFESGAHRVQRVPETESQGRVHTSACTVAILQEVQAVDEIDISNDELRIDTFRASGAGGQHVNKTDSAIRITHLSSGLVVECQDERSQHKNKAKALSLLQARLLTIEQEKQKTHQDETRKKLVGTGDRSDRIRTYNYPQGRVTDHRINLTLYKLADVLAGQLSLIIDPLAREYQLEQLTNLGILD